jgi:hypothetical protein
VTEDDFKSEKNIAICYLRTEGDRGNQCILTTARMVITFRNKDHIFPLETITGIEIERKKMLLPLLSGGIIAPLSFIGFMNFLIAPALSIFAIISGILLFYIGWTGNEVLSINATNQFGQFPVRQGTGGVRDFIEYSKKVIWKSANSALFFYLVFSYDDLIKYDIIGLIQKNESGSDAYDLKSVIQLYEEHYLKGDEILYSFDPVRSGISIKYEYRQHKSIIRVSWPDNLNAADFLKMGSISEFYRNVDRDLLKEG